MEFIKSIDAFQNHIRRDRVPGLAPLEEVLGTIQNVPSLFSSPIFHNNGWNTLPSLIHMLDVLKIQDKFHMAIGCV